MLMRRYDAAAAMLLTLRRYITPRLMPHAYAAAMPLLLFTLPR